MRRTEDAVRSLKRYVAEALSSTDWDVRLAEEEGVFERPFAMVWASGPAITRGSAHYTEYTQPFLIHLYPVPKVQAADSLQEAMTAEDELTWAFINGLGLGSKFRVPLYDYREPANLSLANTGAVAALELNEAHLVHRSELSAEVVPNADNPGTHNDLIITEGIKEERYVHPRAAITALAATINGASTLVRATALVDGTALAALAETPFTAGFSTPMETSSNRRAAVDFLLVRDFSVNRQRDPDDPLLYTVVASARCVWKRGKALPSWRTVKTFTVGGTGG